MLCVLGFNVFSFNQLSVIARFGFSNELLVFVPPLGAYSIRITGHSDTVYIKFLYNIQAKHSHILLVKSMSNYFALRMLNALEFRSCKLHGMKFCAFRVFRLADCTLCIQIQSDKVL